MTDTAITPFRIAVSDADLADLTARLEGVRLPLPSPVADWSRGVPDAYLASLAAYWTTGFDWRAMEARLNRMAQFTTLIDGQRFHFVHVRSENPDAVPLILCHGWPGSFVEFERIVGPLSARFHVVVPSLPGFGYSTPLSGPGWDMPRSTAAYATIMERLGYRRYLAHGSDIGAGIAGHLAAAHPDRVIGVHSASERAAATYFGLFLPLPADLSEAEQAAIAAIKAEQAERDGYFRLQGTRPHTLAYALADSPAGQLAWIVEKFKEWTNPGKALPHEAVDRDQLLANVSLYWFTNSGGSSAQFYYETQHATGGWMATSDVPSGTSVFDAHPIIRRVLDPRQQSFFWAEHAEGGHFPAMEAPELLVADLMAFADLLAAHN